MSAEIALDVLSLVCSAFILIYLLDQTDRK